MDFRKIEISVYSGVLDTIGHRSTLFDFLNNVDYDAISELRASADPVRCKEIKLALPQATISGVFSPTRSAENLVRHSGLICVDIDRKDNLHIDNFDTLIPDVFSRIEEVLFAAHSVSGQGYFLIIPLRYPHRHKEHFEALARQFAEMRISIDRACGDVCRHAAKAMTLDNTSIWAPSRILTPTAIQCQNSPRQSTTPKNEWPASAAKSQRVTLTSPPHTTIGCAWAPPSPPSANPAANTSTSAAPKTRTTPPPKPTANSPTSSAPPTASPSAPSSTSPTNPASTKYETLESGAAQLY